jgi:SAM-dependent methyltransferase
MNLKGAGPERFGAVSSFLYRVWGEPALAPLHLRIGAEVPIERGSLLDIGCGPGRLDRLLAAARPELRVVGLDSSPEMLRQAEWGPRPPNLEFRLGTIETAGSREEFDFALSVLSFHHWEEPSNGLEAVHRALKPGGRFWIYEPDAEAPEEEIRRDRAPFWGWFRLPIWLERLMRRGHGFTEREIEESVRPVVEASPFRSLDVVRTGSTFRIAMTKR